MNDLVMHHRYTLGSTFDISGRNNHGTPHGVIAGNTPFAHTVRFTAAHHRIAVGPSPTLARLIATAVYARFLLEDVTVSRRYNLVEGHLSFALYIQPGGMLTGTVLDRNGAWTGAVSPAGTVQPNRWHEAWLLHDGISILELQLDGRTVASSFAVPGPVRSVGPLGVAIGNWPDADAYTFAGYLAEVRVYRYDLRRDVESLLDPCCFDGAAFDRAVQKLREGGHLEALHRSPQEVLNVLIRLTALLRGQNERAARRIIQWSQVAFGAFLRRDGAALGRFHDLFEAEALQNPNADEIRTLQEEFAHLAASSGLNEEMLLALAKAACFTVPRKTMGERSE